MEYRQQIHYSLQARDAENELVPISIDQGIGILVWSPLAGGLLSGKYRRNRQAPEGTRHFNNWGESPIYDENKLFDIIEVLVEIADGRKASAAQIALAYLLGRPRISSLIISAYGRAVNRQPCRREHSPYSGGTFPARRRQPAGFALPVLASGKDGKRETQQSRSIVTCSPYLTGSDSSARDRARPSNVVS